MYATAFVKARVCLCVPLCQFHCQRFSSPLIKLVGAAERELPAQRELMAINVTSASSLIFLSWREIDENSG